VSCAETTQDRLGHPAYEMFVLNVDFNGVRFDPLASRSPPYKHIKFGYHLENGRFLLLSSVN